MDGDDFGARVSFDGFEYKTGAMMVFFIVFARSFNRRLILCNGISNVTHLLLKSLYLFI